MLLFCRGRQRNEHRFKTLVQNHCSQCSFSWLNTVFDTCISFTFFCKTLDPSVAKRARKTVFGHLTPFVWRRSRCRGRSGLLKLPIRENRGSVQWRCHSDLGIPETGYPSRMKDKSDRTFYTTLEQKRNGIVKIVILRPFQIQSLVWSHHHWYGGPPLVRYKI